MRAFLLSLLCCFVLASCAYYGDMHGHSQQLNVSTLSTPHIYKPSPPTAMAAATIWWHKFKDPQLNQLISVALSDSPNMQIAETRVRQAQYLARGAGSALWPTLDFNGYVQRQRFSEFGLAPPPFNGRTFNIGTLGLNFNYEFDFWGKNKQALQARVSEEVAAEAELAQARLVLAAAVANTYFQLCNTIAQTQIATANWQVRKQMLYIAADRTRQGIDSEIPVKSLQANVEAARLSLEQYRQGEWLARHQLAVLLGKNPFITEIAAKKFKFQSYNVKLPIFLPASLLAQRPDISAAKARVEAAASQINVAKARFFPNINLSALYSYQGVGLEHLFQAQSQNNALTGAIDLPIFDAGARRANLGVKYAEYDIAVNEYNQAILTALREVADHLSILQTVGIQLAAEKSALNATQYNYKLYNSRYNQGITDDVAVLESKQLLLQHQATQQTLQTRYLQAVVATLKALGGSDSIS